MGKICKLFCLVIVSVMIFTVIFTGVNAASVYERQKKSIFLVLDDSGSMSDQMVSDANYSLQTLLAMTDKEDSVKIYFLNQNPMTFPKIDMQKKDDAMLSKVKDKYPGSNGGTPYDKVKVAQQELRDSASSGDQTEYWLVVFTDGEFDTEAPGDSSNTCSDLEKFAQETLANDTNPRILYITAQGGVPLKPNPKIENLHAVSKPGIIEAMNDASKVITGRVEAHDTSYLDGNKTVTFNLPYPAKNIIVFTQNQKTAVVNSTAATTLNTSEKFTVSYPVFPNPYNLKDSTVCFITAQDKSSIGMGQVTLTFDQPLNPQNTTVLYEPAIGIHARFYNSDGTEVDPTSLSKGDKVKVDFSICDSETKQPIDDSVFGGNITYAAETGGRRFDNTRQFEFEINDNNVEIKMFATLPDGYVLVANQKYNDLPDRRDIAFTLSNGGKFNADFDKLNEAEGINANILINGKPVPADQLQSFKLKIKGENWISSKFVVEENSNGGGFIIHPEKGGITGVFTPEIKTYEVELTDKNGTKHTADLTVEIPGPRPWWKLIVFIVCVLAVIYIIWVLCTKKFFPRGTRFRYYQDDIPTITDPVLPIRQLSLFSAFMQELKHKPGMFLLHMLQQLLPNTPVKVIICGVYQDIFGQVTIEAAGSSKCYITAKKEKTESEYRENIPFAVYDENNRKLDPTQIVISNEKKHKATCYLGNYLNVEDEDTYHYLQFTTKKQIIDRGY